MYKTKRLSFHARARSGFSLVEMIGVLAIIAILAVIIVPKVFSTIASSRVTSTAGSITSIKASITEFAGKYGTVPFTTASPNNRLDDLLLAASMLEGRFVAKIGTQPPIPAVSGGVWTQNAATGVWAAAGGASQVTQSRILSIPSNAALAPNLANGANFFLDPSNTALPAGSRVIFAVIMQCTGTEARELSAKMDGDSMTQPTPATLDASGKVVYNTPNAAGLTDVYIYITHQ